MRIALFITSALFLASCSDGKEPDGFDGLLTQVQNHRVGSDTDQWIEIKNAAGEWEKTGLIFGYYVGDNVECQNAIAGLKKVNYLREYRCTPAN